LDYFCLPVNLVSILLILALLCAPGALVGYAQTTGDDPSAEPIDSASDPSDASQPGAEAAPTLAPTPPAPTLTPTPTATPTPLTESDIAAAVGPSVVQVITDTSEGSGVRVEAGILTNAHVVSDAHKIEVATSDKRRSTARVLRIDNNGDLALLQTDLVIPPLPMEFMGQQRQGDEVLVVGYPLGLRDGGGQATLTRGLISGTGKDETTGQALIQTDAAINHGNSGGAMVNMRAKLIGIPAYGLRANGAQGVNFAIAMDTVNAFMGMPQSAVAPQPPKPTATPTPTPAPILYAGIAYDSYTGRAGWAWQYADLSAAQSAAIRSCGQHGCVIVQWVSGDDYAALATGYGGWGTSGTRHTRADAEAYALASCGQVAMACRVIATIHN
jgi:S1-C subfamily serine protease